MTRIARYPCYQIIENYSLLLFIVNYLIFPFFYKENSSRNASIYFNNPSKLTHFLWFLTSKTRLKSLFYYSLNSFVNLSAMIASFILPKMSVWTGKFTRIPMTNINESGFFFVGDNFREFDELKFIPRNFVSPETNKMWPGQSI